MVSRRKRLEEALSDLSDCMSEVECLRDELQEWLDNMPENLQGGAKADELENAISQLDEIYEKLEEAQGEEVEFPSMF